MEGSIIDQFRLPDGAAEAIKRNGMTKLVPLEDGVSRINGDDNGVAYRFYIHTEYNSHKSKAARYEVFDEVEMIEWLADKYNQPVEQVRFLPPELLSIDDTGEAYGEYAETYERFKAGLSAPGTPLTKWGVLTDGLVATLAASKIHSVEQFAAQPRERILKKFGQDSEIAQAFDRAIQYVNGKNARYQVDKVANELYESKKVIEQQQFEIEQMKEMLAFTQGVQTGKGKAKGKLAKPVAQKPKSQKTAKATIDDELILGDLDNE